MVFYVQYYNGPYAKIVYYCIHRSLATVKASGQHWLSRMLLVPVLWAAGLGPAILGRADPIDTVLSAEPAGAEALDGLSAPEVAAADSLDGSVRPGRSLG